MAIKEKDKYLKSKYNIINGESESTYKGKSKKKNPKKSNHKHIYQNIIIEYTYPKDYPILSLAGKEATALESYCTICGKMSYPQPDEEAKHLFPNITIGHFGFISYRCGKNDELKQYHDWALQKYPHYRMPDYNESMYKSGQKFLNLDNIIYS